MITFAVRIMYLRKGNITVVALMIALIAMIMSLYVPHHHHREAICIGSYDCEGEANHSHHDDCGGKNAKYTCFLDGEYIDSRHLDDDRSDFSFKDYVHLVAIIDGWINGCFCDHKVFLRPVFLAKPLFAAPVLRLETRRGPPVR